MANFLDKAIAAISPEKGYRRAVARTALSVINNGTGYGNYGASHTSRSMRSWHVGGGSAKEDIEDNLETLRKRSRDALHGHSAGGPVQSRPCALMWWAAALCRHPRSMRTICT